MKDPRQPKVGDEQEMKKCWFNNLLLHLFKDDNLDE